MIITKSPQQPATLLIISIFIYCTYSFLLMNAHNFDMYSIICAGDVITNANEAPEKLKILKNSSGYDGQYYYRLSINPFTTKKTEYGITFDSPSYRHSRIGYPIFVWLLSTGNPHLIPYIMYFLNLALLCSIGWIGGYYVKSLEINTFWGILFAFLPGLIFSLSRDLAEILEILMILLSLYFIREKRMFIAMLFLSYAVLVRSTAIIVVAAIFLSLIISNFNKKSNINFELKYLIIPIIIYLLWQIVLFFIWGQTPEKVGIPISFSYPVQGLYQVFYNNLATIDQNVSILYLFELILVVLFCISVVAVMNLSNCLLHEKCSFILYFTMFLFYTPAILGDDWAFFRVLLEMFLFGLIIILTSPVQWLKVLWAITLFISIPFYTMRILMSV